MYPTPYDKVMLGAIPELIREFGLPVGLSDHSIGIYTSLGAVALGACALEKHFTISRSWPGPDTPISIEPDELEDLAGACEGHGISRFVVPRERGDGDPHWFPSLAIPEYDTVVSAPSREPSAVRMPISAPSSRSWNPRQNTIAPISRSWHRFASLATAVTRSAPAAFNCKGA